MIVVIQCAASKRGDAGHLTTASGRPVDFVADPQSAPHTDLVGILRDLAHGSHSGELAR